MKLIDKLISIIPNKTKCFLYRNIIKLIAINNLKYSNIDLTKTIIFCKNNSALVEAEFIKNKYIKLSTNNIKFREHFKLVDIEFDKFTINWIPSGYNLYLSDTSNLASIIKMAYNSFINIKNLSLENTNYNSEYNENKFFMNLYMTKILNEYV